MSPTVNEERTDLFDLSGHVALVTGAGQGVGAGIATRLAQRGCAVVINDLDPERAGAVIETLRASGRRAIAAPGDVADPATAQSAIRDAGDVFGQPVDILVNNAGVPPSGLMMGPFADSDAAAWDVYVRINLYGVLHFTKAVVPGMVAGGWGRIITIVSDAGRFGEPTIAVYGAVKAAAAGFVRCLAKEVGERGVTCNALSLGSIDPPGGDPAAEARARRYPMKRLGRPDDVAAAAVWLASEEAGWVTGQTISINGGYNTGP